MTDPHTLGDSPTVATTPSTEAPPPPEAAASVPFGADEGATHGWPSLATPPSGSDAAPGFGADVASPLAAPVPAFDPAPPPVAVGDLAATSLFEPADRLPATQVSTVGDPTASSPGRGRPGARWILALVGVVIVAAASFVIVSLVGGRPAESSAMGYMPESTVMYSEIRLDLPGDQRQKLASFMKAFPGFSDPSAIEPKIDDIFDRLVRAATKDQQTWTSDIKPWFGGQIAIGAGAPSDPTAGSGMSGGTDSLVAVTISDRAKTIAWLMKSDAGSGTVTLNRSVYAGADLFEVGASKFAIAVNDQVLLGGSTATVKAALDTGGKGTLAGTADLKAALATVDKDYVAFGVVRIRTYADAVLKLLAKVHPDVLDKTQIDETALALIPAWQAQTARFENDAIVASTVAPPWSIGFDGVNGPSDVLAHIPAKTFLYGEVHDAGPTVTAILARFRALDEAKVAFAQVDQVLSLVGGGESAYGWWGDTALVVTPTADGTIGGGLVIHPRDAAVADRFFSTLNGYIALAGSSSGITSRTEDHNGTRITILDLSAVPGMGSAKLPPGYKPEFAWATNADVAVIGYGSNFVKAVLDTRPGSSLADGARFKALLGRVGAENTGLAFLDLAAIRSMIEPLAQAQATPDEWSRYTTDVQPYLKPIDAVISAIRKDGNLDRGSAAFTVTAP